MVGETGVWRGREVGRGLVKGEMIVTPFTQRVMGIWDILGCRVLKTLKCVGEYLSRPGLEMDVRCWRMRLIQMGVSMG